MPDTTARIRELNDELRCQYRGGTITMTVGIEAMGAEFIHRCCADQSDV
jgi:hypothetical protein